VAPKKANFLKIGNFEHPSLTHRTSQRHQIFRFTRGVCVLVDCQVLAHSTYNLGRYWEQNFEKLQKFVNVWGLLTRVREEIQKKCSNEYFKFIA